MRHMECIGCSLQCVATLPIRLSTQPDATSRLLLLPNLFCSSPAPHCPARKSNSLALPYEVVPHIIIRQLPGPAQAAVGSQHLGRCEWGGGPGSWHVLAVRSRPLHPSSSSIFAAAAAAPTAVSEPAAASSSSRQDSFNRPAPGRGGSQRCGLHGSHPSAHSRLRGSAMQPSGGMDRFPLVAAAGSGAASCSTAAQPSCAQQHTVSMPSASSMLWQGWPAHRASSPAHAAPPAAPPLAHLGQNL